MRPEAILRVVLAKAPEERRMAEINFLQEVTKNVKFFQNLKPELRVQLLKVRVAGTVAVWLHYSLFIYFILCFFALLMLDFHFFLK